MYLRKTTQNKSIVNTLVENYFFEWRDASIQINKKI